MASRRRKKLKEDIELSEPENIPDNFNETLEEDTSSVFQEYPWVFALGLASVSGIVLWGWNRVSISALEDVKPSAPDSAEKIRELWNKVTQVEQKNQQQDTELANLQKATWPLNPEKIEMADKLVKDLKKIKSDIETTVTAMNAATISLNNNWAILGPVGAGAVTFGGAYLGLTILFPMLFGRAEVLAARKLGSKPAEAELYKRDIKQSRSFLTVVTSLALGATAWWISGGPSTFALSQLNPIKSPQNQPQKQPQPQTQPNG